MDSNLIVEINRIREIMLIENKNLLIESNPLKYFDDILNAFGKIATKFQKVRFLLDDTFKNNLVRDINLEIYSDLIKRSDISSSGKLELTEISVDTLNALTTSSLTKINTQVGELIEKLRATPGSNVADIKLLDDFLKNKKAQMEMKVRLGSEIVETQDKFIKEAKLNYDRLKQSIYRGELGETWRKDVFNKFSKAEFDQAASTNLNPYVPYARSGWETLKDAFVKNKWKMTIGVLAAIYLIITLNSKVEPTVPDPNEVDYEGPEGDPAGYEKETPKRTETPTEIPKRTETPTEIPTEIPTETPERTETPPSGSELNPPQRLKVRRIGKVTFGPEGQ